MVPLPDDLQNNGTFQFQNVGQVNILNRGNTDIPVPLLPDCCVCDPTHTEPLCLVEIPDNPPESDDGLYWWVIVLVVLGGIGVALLVGFFFWLRLRKSELYLKHLELHHKRSRPPMPGESATFVWTDIANSTELWETSPLLMDRAVAVHFKLLRSLLKKHNGYESMTEGDALFCVFHDESDAIAWASDAQQYMLQPSALLGQKAGGGGGATASDRFGKHVSTDWSEELLSLGPASEEFGEGDEDGALLFRGLKVRIGIHNAQLHNEEESDRHSKSGHLSPSSMSSATTESSDHMSEGSVIGAGEDNDDNESSIRHVARWMRAHMPFGKRERDGNASPRNSIDSDGAAGGPLLSSLDDAFADISMRQARLRYWGPAVELTKSIADMASGGIVLISGACASHASLNDIGEFIQLTRGGVDEDTEPNPIAIFSLGSYLLSPDLPETELLVVLPTSLLERLKRVRAIRQMSESSSMMQLSPSIFDAPGFREEWDRDWRMMTASTDDLSGHPHNSAEKMLGERLGASRQRSTSRRRSLAPILPEVTVVFVLLHGRQAMMSGVSKRIVHDSMAQFVQCVRDQLSALTYGDAYECENNDGDFVLSFRRPDIALLFAMNLHSALMEVDWNPRLLELDECQTMYGPSTRPNTTSQEMQLLYRGLRCRVGVLCGRPHAIRAHASTGRAAYYGTMMNRCARMTKMAAPGQTLCDIHTWITGGDARMVGERGSEHAPDGNGDHETTTTTAGGDDSHNSIGSNDDDIIDAIGRQYKMTIRGNGGSIVELIGVDLGSHKFKGIQEEIHVVQSSSALLEARPIPVRLSAGGKRKSVAAALAMTAVTARPPAGHKQ